MADLTRKTAQLFNKATALANTAISDLRGNTFSSNGLNASDYISVSGMNKLSITNTLSSRWGAFYDTNKVYVSGFNGYGTINVPQNAAYVRITVTDAFLDSCMVNEGNSLLPFEPYGWVHSLRKQCSATETIQSGDTIYANGQPITTYTLKGNEEHTGTPSPQNPVMPQGTGNKTANLLEYKRAGYNLGTNGYLVQTNDYDMWFAPVTAGQTYVAQNVSGTYGFYTSKPPERDPVTYDGSRVTFSVTQPVITVPQGVSYIGIRTVAGTTNAMLNEGATVKPYEPYGFKIPILNNSQTTNVYLGEVQTTRKIKKLVLTGQENWIRNEATAISNANAYYITRSDYLANVKDGYCSHYNNITDLTESEGVFFGGSINILTKLADNITTADEFKAYLQAQYSAGTPVTVWYVLQTATTGIVNEPLMKIGDYADTLSNAAAIPTTDGANTISVDTTVQPSEFSATWTGWHDSSVKEYDGSDWQ